MTKRKAGSRKKGFTLIELLVVVLIIGILAAIAVPQYFKVVEKGKAAEAFHWIAGLKGAQEAHLARKGTYAVAFTDLDVNLGALKNFTQPTAVATGGGANPTWSIALTRNAAIAVYGAYVVSYTAPPGSFDCSTPCKTDLLP